MSAFITAVGLVLATSPAQTSEQWIAMTATDSVVIGVERESVRRDGDEVTFNAINAWKQGQHGDYAISEMRVNCVARTFQLGDRSTYEADGEKIATFTTPGPVSSFGPSSGMASVFHAVCEDVWPTNFSASQAPEFYSLAVEAMSGGR